MRTLLAPLARLSRRRTVRLAATLALVGATFAGLAAPASACSGTCPFSLFSDVNSGSGVQVGGTYQPLVGNFAGDPETDILWYAPGTTPDSLWLGTATHGSFTKMPMTINGSYIPLVGNFAGDSHDDILWYSPGTGADTLWTSVVDPAHPFASSTFTINGTYTPVVLHNHPAFGAPVGAADRTTRRSADVNITTPTTLDTIVWSAPAPAADSYWAFSNTGHTAHAIAISGSPQLLPISLDNDGSEDLVAYSPGSGPDAIYRSNGSGGYVRSTISVNGTYTPVALDGQPGGQSILWFGRGSAADSLWVNVGGTLTPQVTDAVSVSGPIVTGDNAAYLYDASGVDQLYVQGLVYGSASADVGPGARPFTGDFDGSGTTDVFFYRPGSASDTVGYGAA
jgi:hypothetical protein